MLRLLRIIAIVIASCAAPAVAAAPGAPVLIGIDAEFGEIGSYSAEAIAHGVGIAVAEINAGGGVLGGRPLQIVSKANGMLPARSATNLRALAATADLVAVVCGRYSPTVLDNLELIHELGLPVLDPWASADGIVDNGRTPNFVFRLALRDSWASATMLGYLQQRRLRKVGLLSLETAWGRSTRRAVEDHVARRGGIVLVGNRWLNWNDNDVSVREKLESLRRAGAEAVLLTGNVAEAIRLARALLALPKEQRLPVVSHWGISGGDLPGAVGERFAELDFKVVQTYSFVGDRSPTARRVAAAYARLTGRDGPRAILAPVGVAHAYDLTQILARAIDLAGSTDRRAIRDALERVDVYAGLVRRYAPPFTPMRHEALSAAAPFIAAYAPDGALERLR